MLRCSTLPCTTLITLHYATLIAAHYKYNYNHNYNYNYSTLITLRYTTLCYAMLRYTTLHYATWIPTTTTATTTTTLQHTTLHYITLHHTHYTTPQLQLQVHYATTTTPLHDNYNYNCNYSCTTPHYIQLLWVTTATIATAPKNTTPTTFQSISGFALPSMHHNNSPLL